MNKHIEKFLDHLRYEKCFSKHTIDAYQNDLQQFFLWLKENSGQDVLLKDLTYKDIRSYLASCFNNYQSISIKRRLSALRSFFNFCCKSGDICQNPMGFIENPKVPRPLPKPVSVEEAFLLCDNESDLDIIKIRDKTICELLYASGIRVSELCNLNLADVDLKNNLLRVMGKGKKERIVPIHNHCNKILSCWLASRALISHQDLEKDALFLGQKGKRINARVVRSVLANLGKQLGFKENLHPHRLRHAFATHMLESGADLKGIKDLLGHGSISSTEHYTKVDLSSLMKEYDKSHPLSKKKKEFS